MQTSQTLTEKELAENFEQIQSELTERIREYEAMYPEFAGHRAGEDEVVQQPVYTYEIHAVS